MDDKTLVLGNNRAAVVWDMPSRKVVRVVPGTGLGETCSIAPAGRKVVFAGAAQVRLHDLNDGRLLYSILLLGDDPQTCAFLSPDGFWRGKPELEKEFVYVVQTLDGRQETLTPAEFAHKYRWKNDPQKATK